MIRSLDEAKMTVWSKMTERLYEISGNESKVVQIKDQLRLWTFEIITWLILSKTVYLKSQKLDMKHIS